MEDSDERQGLAVGVVVQDGVAIGACRRGEAGGQGQALRHKRESQATSSLLRGQALLDQAGTAGATTPSAR
jgi:hypothetical protein